jgi:hypothetical protein
MSAVPPPTFGPTGFIAPPESVILAGVQSDIDAAFGGGLNPALSTPQGQIATSQTAIIGDMLATFLWYCSQIDPAYSSGRMQDAIGRLYGIERIPAEATVVQATCSGLTGVLIPVGALAQALDGNLYTCTQAGIIPASGSIVLPFQCAATGPIACPGSVSIGGAGSLDTIYQYIPGWDSISNVDDGVLGRDTETRSEFEARRSASTGINSSGPLGAILAAVLQVPGVLDAYATENDTASPVMIGGVSINPNSLYVCVLGGAATDVAFAIWTRKPPGCNYTGNTTVVVADPNPQYAPPVPTYNVTFETSTIVNFAVLATIVNSPTVPSTALAQIQGVVLAAFAGTDGGLRAKIGSTVLASRYYAGIAMLGAWAQIVEIQIGITGAAAQFTGAISGTALTVSGITGTIVAGQLLQDPAGLVANGTTIVSGSGTSWVVSKPQTVAAEAMNATALYNFVQMNINQAPAIALNNVALALQ